MVSISPPPPLVLGRLDLLPKFGRVLLSLADVDWYDSVGKTQFSIKNTDLMAIWCLPEIEVNHCNALY
ncbi:MAG: hypothetical protein V7727_18480, partial [Sneathiella sp.]